MYSFCFAAAAGWLAVWTPALKLMLIKYHVTDMSIFTTPVFKSAVYQLVTDEICSRILNIIISDFVNNH